MIALRSLRRISSIGLIVLAAATQGVLHAQVQLPETGVMRVSRMAQAFQEGIHYNSVGAAIAAANEIGGTDHLLILVYPGEYAESIEITRDNVVIRGLSGAHLQLSEPIAISGGEVTLENLRLSGAEGMTLMIDASTSTGGLTLESVTLDGPSTRINPPNGALRIRKSLIQCTGPSDSLLGTTQQSTTLEIVDTELLGVARFHAVEQSCAVVARSVRPGPNFDWQQADLGEGRFASLRLPDLAPGMLVIDSEGVVSSADSPVGEGDTLASVTSRGAVTTETLTMGGLTLEDFGVGVLRTNSSGEVSTGTISWNELIDRPTIPVVPPEGDTLDSVAIRGSETSETLTLRGGVVIPGLQGFVTAQDGVLSAQNGVSWNDITEKPTIPQALAETDSLQTVTDRGAVTTGTLTMGGLTLEDFGAGVLRTNSSGEVSTGTISWNELVDRPTIPVVPPEGDTLDSVAIRGSETSETLTMRGLTLNGFGAGALRTNAAGEVSASTISWNELIDRPTIPVVPPEGDTLDSVAIRGSETSESLTIGGLTLSDFGAGVLRTTSSGEVSTGTISWNELVDRPTIPVVPPEGDTLESVAIRGSETSETLTMRGLTLNGFGAGALRTNAAGEVSASTISWNELIDRPTIPVVPPEGDTLESIASRGSETSETLTMRGLTLNGFGAGALRTNAAGEVSASSISWNELVDRPMIPVVPPEGDTLESVASRGSVTTEPLTMGGLVLTGAGPGILRINDSEGGVTWGNISWEEVENRPQLPNFYDPNLPGYIDPNGDTLDAVVTRGNYTANTLDVGGLTINGVTPFESSTPNVLDVVGATGYPGNAGGGISLKSGDGGEMDGNYDGSQIPGGKIEIIAGDGGLSAHLDEAPGSGGSILLQAGAGGGHQIEEPSGEPNSGGVGGDIVITGGQAGPGDFVAHLYNGLRGGDVVINPGGVNGSGFGIPGSVIIGTVGSVGVGTGTPNPLYKLHVLGDTLLQGTLSPTNLNVTGSTIVGSTGLQFEGSTADANETSLQVVNPTADRTITLPDASGTVPLLGSNQTWTGAQSFDGATTINAASGLQFEGSVPDANETSIQATNPTADRTITLPDASGTVALLGSNQTWTGAQAFDGATTINAASGLQFEGSVADAHETAIQVSNPTADRTITLPNASGTVALLNQEQVWSQKQMFDVGLDAGTVRAQSLIADNASALGSLTATNTLNPTAPAAKIIGGLNIGRVTYSNTTPITLDIQAGAYHVFPNHTQNITITLPTVTSADAGQLIIIKNADDDGTVNTLLVKPASGQKIDNITSASGFTISSAWGRLQLVCTGSGWEIIESN